MEIGINLIPPARREQILKAHRFRMVIRVGMAMAAIAVMFFSYLAGIDRVLKINYETVSASPEIEKDKVQYEKIRGFDREFDEINAWVSEISTIKRDQFYWSNLFLRLSGAISSGIAIDSLVTKDYGVFLSGNAHSRDELIAFKDKLGEEECFSDLNLPLSNLVEKENISFQMDLRIKEECVRFHPE